jgi:hypothetical protein
VALPGTRPAVRSGPLNGTRPSALSHAGLSESGAQAADRCGGTLCSGMGRLLAVGGLTACPTGACHTLPRTVADFLAGGVSFKVE